MGLTPPAGAVDQACRRALPPPVVRVRMFRLLLLVRPDARRLEKMHSTHVSCVVKMLS